MEVTLSLSRKMFDTNILAIIDINTTFLPLLRLSRGTIVHIGSVGSMGPVPWNAIYCASKAALYSYTDTLRLELGVFGIKVKIVQTGMVGSNMQTGASERV